jgi:16S rRNA (cytosine967-C5)-methyltransferase
MVDGRQAAPARAVGVKPTRRQRAEPPGLASRIAATTLFRAVIENGQKLDEAFEVASTGLGHGDAALVRAISTSTLRHLGDIELALARHLTKPLPAKAGLTRAILATAAAQLFYMRVPAHATIDLAVRQAKADRKAQHQASLVNAILRKLEREGAGEPVAGANIPAPFSVRWRENWGDAAFTALAAELLREPPLDLSVKGNEEQWAERLGARVLSTGSLRIDRPRGAIEALAGFDEGAWWVQDAAAALPVGLMGDIGGKQVLDLFAAPGGKTAQLTAAGAEVTAIDHSAQRMERLRQNLARLNLRAQTVLADALVYEPQTPFDAVLLDAPCSATGTARRNPDVLYHRTMATCSLEPEEGEQQIARFLAESCDFHRVPVTPPEVGGLAVAIDANGDVRTLPGQVLNGDGSLDGFFIARLRRNQSSLSER